MSIPDHSPLSFGLEKPGIPLLPPQVTKPLAFTSASVAADAAEAKPRTAAPIAADRIVFFIFPTFVCLFFSMFIPHHGAGSARKASRSEPRLSQSEIFARVKSHTLY